MGKYDDSRARQILEAAADALVPDLEARRDAARELIRELGALAGATRFRTATAGDSKARLAIGENAVTIRFTGLGWEVHADGGASVTVELESAGIVSVTMRLGSVTVVVAAVAGAAGAGAFAAAGVADGAAAGWRSSTHASTAAFTASSAPRPIAHIGYRLRGGATLTSNKAGDAWRWRSVSDFLRASRMKDTSNSRR